MKRLKTPLYVLRARGRQRDKDAFERAHKDAGETLGWGWLHAHLRVTKVLEKFGYSTEDERVAAIASLAGLGEFTALYSSELEIPERRR
jgi:hypothetical protein